MKARFLAAAAVSAALLAACSGGGQTIVPPSNNNNDTQSPSSVREFTSLTPFVARNNTTGELVRTFPTRDGLQAFRLSQAGQRSIQSTANLSYHGGPVQTAPKIYVVFWGSAWTGSGDPNGERNYYNNFMSLIGGSKWLNSVTQYTQSDGQAVGNLPGSYVAATQSYIDTSSRVPKYPTQTQLATEAAKAAAKYNDYSPNASYVVALPHGIVPSGFGTQYCAWHSWATVTGKGNIQYTNLPYMSDVGAACGVGAVNSPGTLDGVSIVGGHEQGETETDPQPNSGWVDLTDNSENGDKCAWIGLEDNPYVGNYPTQPLWSNATSSCVQSY